jgi:hypothetical protein
MIETFQNTVDESLVNKIKGLLRLATSSNQHEAELALSRAHALCVKHELDMASLNAFEDKPTNEPVTKGQTILGKRMSICQHYVSHILQDFFNVRVIYSGGRYLGKTINFVGRKRDIELAEYLNQFLNAEFLRLWNKYYTENEVNGITLRHRGGFLYGLKQGLSEKLSESQKKTETETFTAIPIEKTEQIKNCYALAVINHKKNLEEKVCEFYPRLRSNGHSHTIHNFSANDAGNAIGRTINLNRPIANSNSSQIRC